ncbi:hypothetical protein PT974_04046 [Cladobotryum mycophilum]|uniref:Uncharacterized protein n=1 Tax=Cladobotryum mycophilum TaxID=491253 RepID=A0ABR0SU20_9HYPO
MLPASVASNTSKCCLGCSCQKHGPKMTASERVELRNDAIDRFLSSPSSVVIPQSQELDAALAKNKSTSRRSGPATRRNTA